MPHHAAYNVPLSELDVAVVDDIPHMTDLFRLMLGAVEVARVRTYNDPMKFLDVCRHDPPHLLITDLAMKPMNGAQLVHLVRREFMDAFCLMAILAVSAHATHENIERTLACGANDFLVKPLSANMLCERLRRLTEDSRQLYLSDEVRRRRFRRRRVTRQPRPTGPSRRRSRRPSDLTPARGMAGPARR